MTFDFRAGGSGLLLVALFGLMLIGKIDAAAQANPDSRPAISIGGEPVVTLQRPAVTDRDKPQFLEATILPGRGMAVLQIKAYLPGKGEIDVLNAPPLADAEQLLDKKDDEFGNEVFKIGGAILLPFANRIRGKLGPDGQTITATVAGQSVSLPANWSGNNPGAEKHAIHGLMRRSQFQNIVAKNGSAVSTVSADFAGGQLRRPLALRHRGEGSNYIEP